MTSVGEDFPRQQERVRKLWGLALQQGPRSPLAVSLESILCRAGDAQASGDLLRILASYSELESVR